MGMRGKKEAGSQEEAGIRQGTQKEKNYVLLDPRSGRGYCVKQNLSGGPRKKTIRGIVFSRKVMNLNEPEDASSSERRILGGILGIQKYRFRIGTIYGRNTGYVGNHGGVGAR